MKALLALLLVTQSVSAMTFVGDSIAQGYKIASNGDGVTKVGASPAMVKEFVSLTPFSGKVVLSTGASNNCNDEAVIINVINMATLKFEHVYLLSAPYCGNRVNEVMRIQCGNNCTFIPVVAGSDGVHPKYKKLNLGDKND